MHFCCSFCCHDTKISQGDLFQTCRMRVVTTQSTGFSDDCHVSKPTCLLFFKCCFLKSRSFRFCRLAVDCGAMVQCVNPFLIYSVEINLCKAASSCIDEWFTFFSFSLLHVLHLGFCNVFNHALTLIKPRSGELRTQKFKVPAGEKAA